ncbi:hypothetical protein KY285_002486 [Solanum tuberosum]|nr:hypothetical protein KY285_002486 [Solanum tuberosum]
MINGTAESTDVPTQKYHLPKRIILVRHGESQGNKDDAAYSVTPDYKIPLTAQGIEQAKQAGSWILDVVSGHGSSENWKVYFYVSPYVRTRSTLREIGRAFPKNRMLGVREECRVREQDFGNFQVAERMKVIKETRERFGRFFYRFPEGESAADVYDRVSRCYEIHYRLSPSAIQRQDVFQYVLDLEICVLYSVGEQQIILKVKEGATNCSLAASAQYVVHIAERMPRLNLLQSDSSFGALVCILSSHTPLDIIEALDFLETLWRDVDMNRHHHNPNEELNLVIVSHGLASRVFLMKWFKWTVEQFEYLNNLGNCEFRVMELGAGGEYSLAVHHTDEEMLEWGMSPEMIADQKWRANANRGTLNDHCPRYLDAFFDHLADSNDKDDEDVKSNNSYLPLA